MIHEHVLWGYDYDDSTNTLKGNPAVEGAGFFSTFTLLLTSIISVYKKFNKLPNIDGSRLLNKLNPSQQINDMYDHFFHINDDIIIPFTDEQTPSLSPDSHHTIYTNENLKYFIPFFERYFNINENILSKIEILKKKYDINNEKIISVVYRDTDKWTDFGGFNSVQPGPYINLTRLLLTDNPTYKVLIQSENDGVVAHFGNAFGSIFFTETLTSQTSVSPVFVHYNGNKIEWSEYYIASLWIHSKSEYLITYTGNSAFFLYLNRGTTKNLYQETTFQRNYNEFFIKES